MRVLIVENSRLSPAGLIGAALAEAGATLHVVAADAGETLPERLDGHDALVVLGGPQDAWDDGQGPHFPQLLRLIREAADAAKPVMGICLGSQLIARAFGARVYRHVAPEIGVLPVTLGEAASADPVLAGLGPVLHVVQWHRDTFDLPAGAVPLAEGDFCARQGFRIGRSVYAFQFHIEATEAIFRQWIANWGEEAGKRQPGVLDGIDAKLAHLLPPTAEAARAVARRWLELAAVPA